MEQRRGPKPFDAYARETRDHGTPCRRIEPAYDDDVGLGANGSFDGQSRKRAVRVTCRVHCSHIAHQLSGEPSGPGNHQRVEPEYE